MITSASRWNSRVIDRALPSAVTTTRSASPDRVSAAEIAKAPSRSP
jgi:hypothetical protein